jgi:hypothetical protein
MSRGILLFACNNEKIDYLKLAYCSSLMIRHHLGDDVGISIVTDPGTMKTSHSLVEKLKSAGVNIILAPSSTMSRPNVRQFSDTQYYSVSAEFINTNRMLAYDLSPYEETLLIDTDYLIQSDSLNKVWGSVEDVMINSSATSLQGTSLSSQEVRLNDFGIKMFWATVIYFKKCRRAEILFQFVEHIKDHWDYYKLIYDFPHSLYRNDYAFSIAIHTLNGFLGNDEIKSLPSPSLLSSTDRDQLYDMKPNGELIFFAQNEKETWKYVVVKVGGLDVHCMNKFSLMYNLNKLISFYGGGSV